MIDDDIEPEIDEAAEEEDEGADEKGRGREPSRQQRQESRRTFRSARELMLEGMSERAAQADPKLRSQLVGSIVLDVADKGERYLMDWSTDQLKIAEAGKADAATPPDTTIRLAEQHLMRIHQGDLNPQIAMLSDKITVTGKPGLAIYFFNLVVPRTQS